MMKFGLALVAVGVGVFVYGLLSRFAGAEFLWSGLALGVGAAVAFALAGWRGNVVGWVFAGLVSAFVVGFTTELSRDRVCSLVAEPGPAWNSCSVTLIVGSLWVGLLAGAVVALGGIVVARRRHVARPGSR